MNSEQVKEIVSRAFTLGMATQQWIYSPPNDMISLNAAIRYLSRLGYKNPKKITLSTSDALLIAEYARRMAL